MIKPAVKTISIFLVVFVLLATVPSKAKKHYPQEDMQAWLSAGVEYELSPDWELDFSEELRYDENRTHLGQALTDLGATYKVADCFSTGLFLRYRFKQEWKDGDNEKESVPEFYVNNTFKFEIWNIELSNRVRFHFKFPDGKENITNLRNKLTLGYDVFDWLEPFVAAEIFYRFFYSEGDRLTQGRYYIGADIKLCRSHELELFLMREEEYNTNKAENSNIFGLGYKFSF